MYLLAIETTGPVGSVCLLDRETGKTYSRKSDEPMSHLKNIMPMAEDLLKEAKASQMDLAAVAASVGPGSFTGIRIGVTSARALAQALDIPAVAVPTLEPFRSLCAPGKPVCVIENARRGQVYGAVYSEDGTSLLEPGPYMLDEVLALIEKENISPCFYGDGVDAYRDRLEGHVFAPEEERYQSAVLVAAMAEQLLSQGKTVSYDDLMPQYMRRTEAEQKLEDGTLAKYRAAKMAKFRSK